jgi:hypothetical protein
MRTPNETESRHASAWRLLCCSGHRPRIQNRLFVGNGPRRRLIHFELGAYLLDLRGLFFELGRQNFHPFLLLRDGGCQLLNFFVLFQELVEQHVVDLLVVDGHNFTISAPHHELGIHLGDLLGDQTILLRAFPVAVEFERYWLEPVQCFTGLVHRFNVVLELSRRRVEDAHVVKLIDKHWYLGRRVANRLAEDAADEAGVIKGSKRTVTRCADRDAVIDAWSQTGAGLVTDTNVAATVNVITERIVTDGCVTGSRCIVLHRKVTERIVFAFRTGYKRVTTMCVVESTADVSKERICAEGVVVGAIGVMDKRVSSNGSVICASGVEK